MFSGDIEKNNCVIMAPRSTLISVKTLSRGTNIYEKCDAPKNFIDNALSKCIWMYEWCGIKFCGKEWWPYVSDCPLWFLDIQIDIHEVSNVFVKESNVQVIVSYSSNLWPQLNKYHFEIWLHIEPWEQGLGVCCEIEVWYTFYRCHPSAVCNIFINRTAL